MKSHEQALAKSLVIVVMGVSGCGKSTIAAHIAQQLGAHCKDADELHSKTNIDKMASGVPLTDQDRQPWLEDIAQYAHQHTTPDGVCVIACSALKRRYRQTINTAGNVAYVFLEGSLELISTRMRERRGHFMPETLLKTQFADLEDPRHESNVLTVSIDADADTIAGNAIELLKKWINMDPINMSSSP